MCLNPWRTCCVPSHDGVFHFLFRKIFHTRKLSTNTPNFFLPAPSQSPCQSVSQLFRNAPLLSEITWWVSSCSGSGHGDKCTTSASGLAVGWCKWNWLLALCRPLQLSHLGAEDQSLGFSSVFLSPKMHGWIWLWPAVDGKRAILCRVLKHEGVAHICSATAKQQCL